MAINAHISVDFIDQDAIALQRRGFADAAAGRSFDKAYEVLAEPAQRNYEIGRMMAYLIRAQGVEPEWRETERSGAMFRRLLGDGAGRATVRELNIYASRDAA